MDRVIFTDGDLDRLFAWRDAHKSEVRMSPAPLQEIEILIEPTNTGLKAFRDGDRLKLYLLTGNERLGKGRFVRRPDGMWICKKSSLPQDVTQSCLSVYCSLMALMAYTSPPAKEDGDIVPDTVSEQAQPISRGNKKAPARKKAAPGITYILKSYGDTVLVAPKGSHMSPRGIFTVRGHYRHYRSGKVVWVAEFKKGTGKRKNKTYKMGSAPEG